MPNNKMTITKHKNSSVIDGVLENLTPSKRFWPKRSEQTNNGEINMNY